MNNIEKAISAARGELRHQGFKPCECSGYQAERILDDLGRQGIEAGVWFLSTSDNQIRKFRKEWNKWILL